jgi:sugar lactone lactonase YvrE
VFDMPRPNHLAPAAIAIPLIAALAGGAGCGGGDPPGPSGDVVELPGADFYPEGVAIAGDGSTYVASILTGAIVEIERGEATATAFVAAGAIAASSVGLLASDTDDLLWLCVGTYGTTALPSIAAIDRDTGAERVRHHFPPQTDGSTTGLCNELAEDDAGNLYVTDSFGARILRVAAADRRTPDRLAVWAAGAALAPAPMGFGANGIAFDRAGGAILAVNTSTGALIRVAINPDGSAGAPAPVALPRPLVGPDGLRVVEPGVAVVVEQYAGALTRIDLDAAPIALTTLRDGLRDPTSLDVAGDTAWVSEGQLSHIFDMTAPELPFTVVRVAVE